MTINDIMQRDMQDEERRERMLLDLDREIRRRLRRKLLRAVAGEVAGGIAFFALLAATAWLCCVASGYHWE